MFNCKKSKQEKLRAELEAQGSHLGARVKDAVKAARKWAEPHVDEAYAKAAPLVKDAYGKANEVAHEAVDRARPYVADAAKLYEQTAHQVREDYLPRVKRAADAAVTELRSGDLTSAYHASKQELAKPKKRRGRKVLGFLLVASAGAAAAYVAWARSRPVSDPWAEAYWEDVAVTDPDNTEVETGDMTEGEATEGEAAHVEPTEEQLKKEELSENVAKTRESEAAEAAGLLDEDK